MNDNLTIYYALEYFDRGWSVIPCVGKRPFLPWVAYQQRRSSVEEIRRWFGESRCYNIAIVTGSLSGLIVVDCDSEEDSHWWKEQFEATPLAVTTGGGGTHFYYRSPGVEVRNRVGVLGRRIDIRGDGGLAVAPPSTHPQTAGVYRWQVWAKYALEEVPVFELDWLAPISAQVIAPELRSKHRRNTSINDGPAYIQHIQAISGDGGHKQTFRAACKLRDAGISPQEALDVLAEWNETNARPPWTAKELAHKIRDAFHS